MNKTALLEFKYSFTLPHLSSLCLRLQYVTSPFPFPSQTFPDCVHSPSNSCPLFLLIVIACIYAYTHIPKYNLLSPYNITCLCIFRVDLLALDHQFKCSSLGRTTFLTTGFSQLPTALRIGLKSHTT